MSRLEPIGEIIYFVRLYKGVIKIGYTTDLERRLSDFRALCPFAEVRAKFNGSKKAEKFMHRLFRPVNINSELFREEGILYNFLNSVRYVGIEKALDFAKGEHEAFYRSQHRKRMREAGKK